MGALDLVDVISPRNSIYRLGLEVMIDLTFTASISVVKQMCNVKYLSIYDFDFTLVKL